MENTLRRLAESGLHLKAEFVATIIDAQDQAAVLLEEAVFAQFLQTDMNLCGSGCLPPDICSQHNITLMGRKILQIDEAANIAVCAKQR